MGTYTYIGIGLMVYHALISYLAFQARKDETLSNTVGILCTVFHLAMLFGFYLWYKVSESQVKAFTKKQKAEAKAKK